MAQCDPVCVLWQHGSRRHLERGLSQGTFSPLTCVRLESGAAGNIWFHFLCVVATHVQGRESTE